MLLIAQTSASYPSSPAQLCCWSVLHNTSGRGWAGRHTALWTIGLGLKGWDEQFLVGLVTWEYCLTDEDDQKVQTLAGLVLGNVLKTSRGCCDRIRCQY